MSKSEFESKVNEDVGKDGEKREMEKRKTSWKPRRYRKWEKEWPDNNWLGAA